MTSTAGCNDVRPPRVSRPFGRRRLRRSTSVLLRAVGVLTLACALALPANAAAGQDTIWNGSLGYGGAYGPRHSLSSVWATWYDGLGSCLNAWNDSGGWAGSTVCAFPSDTNVGHPYCACQLRYGFGRSYANGASVGYWRQFW